MINYSFDMLVKNVSSEFLGKNTHTTTSLNVSISDAVFGLVERQIRRVNKFTIYFVTCVIKISLS